MPAATLNVSSMLRAAPLRRDGGAGRFAVAPRRAAAGRCSLAVAAAGKSYKITLLPGDGIGPEILKVAVDCLNVVVRARRRRNAAKTSCRVGCCTFGPAATAPLASTHAAPLAHAARCSCPHPPRACALQSRRSNAEHALAAALR